MGGHSSKSEFLYYVRFITEKSSFHSKLQITEVKREGGKDRYRGGGVMKGKGGGVRKGKGHRAGEWKSMEGFLLYITFEYAF